MQSADCSHHRCHHNNLVKLTNHKFSYFHVEVPEESVPLTSTRGRVSERPREAPRGLSSTLSRIGAPTGRRGGEADMSWPSASSSRHATSAARCSSLGGKLRPRGTEATITSQLLSASAAARRPRLSLRSPSRRVVGPARLPYYHVCIICNMI